MNVKDLKIERTELLHQGKANNVYATTSPRYLELEASDRISAGNGERRDVVTGKGAANNKISTAIFLRLEGLGVPTHYAGSGSNECSKIVRRTMPIPLEVIGRFYAAGSFVKTYGVKPMTEFDPVFIEYTHKNDAAGDPRIAPDTIVALGILTRRELGYVEYLTERVAYSLRDFFAECGGKLVDFKVEFGRLPDGRIILIDEISPDTCRILDVVTGESMDKDRFRENLGGVTEAYAEMARRVGEPEEWLED